MSERLIETGCTVKHTHGEWWWGVGGGGKISRKLIIEWSEEIL